MQKNDCAIEDFDRVWADDHVEILIEAPSRGARALMVWPWHTREADIQAGVARAKDMGFVNITAVGNLTHHRDGVDTDDFDYYLLEAAK